MPETGYIAARNADDAERERLGLVETLSDPWTTSRMVELGVAEGWHCAEVAAGAGSIVRWLSARVGDAGHVTATDVDTRFLVELGLPNVEVRRHDIVEESLDGAYDLVHVRWLLLHLQDPGTALEHMVAALKPGGWLFVEDLSPSTTRSADDSHPEAAAFDARTRADLETLAALGVLDPSSGSRVAAAFDTLGLVDVGHLGLSRVARGGSDLARLTRLGAQLAAPLLLARRSATEEEIEAQLARFEDPTFAFCEPTTYQCWGRRPR